MENGFFLVNSWRMDLFMELAYSSQNKNFFEEAWKE